MTKWLCKLRGHRLVLDIMREGIFNNTWRLRCIRCNAIDPYQRNPTEKYVNSPYPAVGSSARDAFIERAAALDKQLRNIP